MEKKKYQWLKTEFTRNVGISYHNIMQLPVPRKTIRELMNAMDELAVFNFFAT